MNERSLLPALCALLMLALLGCDRREARPVRPSTTAQPTESADSGGRTDRSPRQEIPAGAQALLDAYPQTIREYRDNKIILADGTELVYDDGRRKDFATMLDDSDIEDMFSMTYVVTDPPAYLSDAGRSRSDALFKHMYGASAEAVRRNLVNVEWFGQTVQFNRVNGAAAALRAVARDLKAHPELHKYLKSSGTFYWRTVRGARRQSAHSYGIAFDIGIDHSDYWLWKNPGASETDRLRYHNQIPRTLVDIFARHGFIWGGAWYHYDTMHFEYRPEILAFAASND